MNSGGEECGKEKGIEKNKIIGAKSLVTFCEVADDISAAVKSISHHSCSPSQ